MLYFLDTEFIESGAQHPLSLLSIGIVAADGREYYAESRESLLHLANDWVREHVFPHLTWKNAKPNSKICQDIHAFVRETQDGKPIFWGYYADYDWVVFCQLFGSMTDLPPGWPMYCHDLRQHLDHYGQKDISQPEDAPHHALLDARWIRNTYMGLKEEAA